MKWKHLLALCALVVGCGGDATSPVKSLEKIDVLIGTGAEAVAGKVVTVHYTGYLYSEKAEGHRGARFDSSVLRGQPFPFTLGVGAVIRGWDEGVPGMKVGGKRTLIIPPSLGYGSSGNGPIPGNAALVFDIELLAVN